MAKHFTAKYINHVVKRSPYWVAVSKLTKLLILGRCCICPLLPGGDCAHLTYDNLEYELPFRDIVPLNRFFHRIVDSPIFTSKRVKPWRNAFLRVMYAFWIAVELRLALEVSSLFRVAFR
jgi:hypothetical protein